MKLENVRRKSKKIYLTKKSIPKSIREEAKKWRKALHRREIIDSYTATCEKWRRNEASKLMTTTGDPHNGREIEEKSKLCWKSIEKLQIEENNGDRNTDISAIIKNEETSVWKALAWHLRRIERSYTTWRRERNEERNEGRNVREGERSVINVSQIHNEMKKWNDNEMTQ